MCKVQSLIVAPEPGPAFVTIKYSCHHQPLRTLFQVINTNKHMNFTMYPSDLWGDAYTENRVVGKIHKIIDPM